LAVDVALVTVHEGELRALLLPRDEPDLGGAWALPGGFVRVDEDPDDAARRVLASKAGLEGVFLEQLYTFGAPGRDPRGHVISITYYALVDHGRFARIADGVRRVVATLEVPWEGETGGPVVACDPEGTGLSLAFDHADILGLVVKRLRGKLDYAALGFQLLPPRFTLRALQTVHEVVLGRPLNKDSFRRRMLASGRIEPTGELEQDVLHRPAALYRIARESAV